MKIINLLLVDDQALFRESVRSLLHQNLASVCIYEARHGRDALNIMDTHRIDVVLLDVNMPEMNGIEVSNQILSKHKQAKIIILTQHGGEAMTIHLLQQGVHGFLLKNTSVSELKLAIETVIRGEKYIHESVTSLMNNNIKQMKSVPSVIFNKREAEILLQLKIGRSSKEIASVMDLKENTVNSYREDMLRKTKTKNVAELITYAHQNGILG
jgi:DNA-binding NarL/FixJ family response regulator